MANKTIAIDNHNTIKAAEAYSIIKTNASTIINHPELAHSLPPILLRGAPGIGKSTIVREVAKELGIGFIDIRLAEMEPVDLRGLPVPNHANKSVQWYVTSDLPRDKDSKGIILFDEITSADRSLQVAAYELILDRRLGNLYSIPDGWYIVAAGNRVEDHAVATAMSSALANRFMHFDLESDATDWTQWGIKHDIQPSVIGFINWRPETLSSMDGQNLERGWPSPRSWERVSNMIPLYKNNENILRKIVYGLIGPKVGIEFMEFHKINENFSDILEMMTNPNAKIEIPEKSDRLYAFCSCMQYLVWRGEDDDEINKRLEGFLRISMELPADFATMTMMGAMQGNSFVKKEQACSKIVNSNPTQWKAWQAKFGKALRKRYSL